MNPQEASLFQSLGAACFGLIMGWQLYFVNRYRRDQVTLADLGVVLAALGGAAILALFPAKTDLFASYAVGLCIGFFAYFGVLALLVARSPNFSADWFLDGRRNAPATTQTVDGAAPTAHAMEGQGRIRG